LKEKSSEAGRLVVDSPDSRFLGNEVEGNSKSKSGNKELTMRLWCWGSSAIHFGLGELKGENARETA
jgi:hypothetical protein